LGDVLRFSAASETGEWRQHRGVAWIEGEVVLKRRKVKPRKPGWWRDGPPPTPAQIREREKMWAGMGTGFENDKLDDYAWYHLDRNVASNRWVEAAFQFYLNGNDAPMKALLRTAKPTERYERAAVSDYKKRKSPGRGRPSVPFYWLSNRDHKLAMANDEVTSLMQVEEISESDAVTSIAERRGIHPELLQEWRDGRGGDVHRRRKKRRKAGI
jgi:hypothetical protein